MIGTIEIQWPNDQAQSRLMSEAMGWSARSEKLANELVIVGMRSDPKPVHSARR
jgi:hypothetical protein